MTRKKKQTYNWVKKSNNADLRHEPEDDGSQLEALMVDSGVTELMFGDE